MKKVFLISCPVILLLLFSPRQQAQSVDNLLIDNKAVRLLIAELSGERAMDMIHKISRFHRIRGGGPGSGFNQAVDFVVNELKGLGTVDVRVDRFPADGFTTYLGWKSPVGWRVKSAKLWLVEPEWELLADFSHQAVSLMPYSNGGSVEAEVVYVGDGKSDADYEGIDVKDKIVFATGGNGAEVHRKAVLERKAAGVVVGPSYRPDRYEFADLVEMSRLSPTGEERVFMKWGFALSRRQTEQLLSLCKANKKLVMKAEVNAELFDGEMPVISAVVKGTRFPGQEIILMGHLDHYKPGANDNASGSAGLIEIIRGLTTLIKEGKITPPARTLRFLWLPELHGAMAYVAKYTDIGKRGLAGINLDMIGEHYEKCRAYFYSTEPPYSAPGFIDLVIADSANWVDWSGIRSPRGSFIPFNFKQVGYWGGSDHAVFCDPSIGVPSVMLGHGDVFHHSSYDTPDKCDPTELKRVITVTAMAAYAIANADDAYVLKLASAVHRKWLGRLHGRTTQSIKWLVQQASSDDFSKNAPYLFRKILEYSRVIAEIEKRALTDVKKLCQDRENGRFIDGFSRSTAGHLELENRSLTDFYRVLCRRMKISVPGAKLTIHEKKAQSIKPKRLKRGPLDHDFLRLKLGEDNKWYRENRDKVGGSGDSKTYEILNLCDGTKDALFIRDLICVEFGEADSEFVLHLLDDFKRLGVIAY